MYKKIFINIFFEKKRILIGFMCVTVILLMYIGVQTVFYAKQVSNLYVPDVQINGKSDADGVLRFKLYDNLLGLSDNLKKLAAEAMTVYGVTARNIMTIDGMREIERVNYWIYGVSDSFFERELKNLLQQGVLPKAGSKEIVIGSYAARKFNLKLGDLINIPATLNTMPSDNDLMQYKVVGVLSDNDNYFKGAFFLSKDTFKKNNPEWVEDENLAFIYFNNAKGSKAYEELISGDEFINEYKIGGVNNNYIQKQNATTSILLNSLMTFFISCIILFLLISYIMKGITKKIGLLKALGVSDAYINKVFVGGMCISLIVSLALSLGGVFAISKYLNYSMSKFLGFKVEYYIVSINAIAILSGIVFLLFIITFFTAKIKSSRISPRDAMIKV